MRDTDQPNPQSSDESSLVPTSEIVHVGPDSSLPQDASSDSLIIFASVSHSGRLSSLVELIKHQSQLVLGVAIGILATSLLGQLGKSPSSPTALRPMAFEQYLRFNPDGLSRWQTPGELVPNPVEIPPPPGAAALKAPPKLQYVERFYFAQNGDSRGEMAPQPTWFMVDRFYFVGQPTAQATSPLSNGALKAVLPEPGLPLIPPSESYWYPPEPNDRGPLVVPPPPDMPLSVGAQNIPYARYGGIPPISPGGEQKPHTLLGVVETNSFGAALIRTYDGSYSVRVGDTLRQSQYVLSALESDKAIFSDGRNTFIVAVGEKF